MSEPLKEIAMRVRYLREIAGVSTATLAAEFGLTARDIEAYESGDTDVPVSFLVQVCKKFNVEMTELLTGRNPHLQLYSVVRKGEGLSVERSKHYKHWSLGYKFAHKKAEPFLVTVEPGNDTAPSYNQHPGQEFHYMLEGRLRVLIEENEVILEPGDSLFFDSNHRHALKALDNIAATFLAVVV